MDPEPHQPEGLDSMLDRLSPHLRNKVLEQWSRADEPEREDPGKPPREMFLWFLAIIVALTAIPPGVILCVSIIGWPLGIPIMWAGSLPARRLLHRRIVWRIAHGLL